MYEDLLSEIGMTKSEIAVYLALLELGSSTTGSIIKKAGIASGKAYIVLDKLILKGIVTYSIKAGTKHYYAKDPERLLDYIKEREDELKQKEGKLRKIIPALKIKYNEGTQKPITEIYEGIKGLKTFYYWALREMKRGDYIYAMGVPKEANEKHESFFLNWNKKRIQAGVKLRIIYNHDSRQFGKKRERMRLTEVRYLKPELETPAWVDIFNDYVVTMNVHGTPICFLIKNKESADSYKKYFNIIWKQSMK